MKARHMDGMDHPLTLEEILDETNQLDVTGATKMWLSTEALGSKIFTYIVGISRNGIRYCSVK